MIVKLLLIYYGCLGLARSLIMYLQGMGESHLKSSHGLRELDWRHKFSGDIKSFLSLEMKVTDGTSLELQTATANKEYMEIPILKYELAHHSRPFSINRGDLISVDTILSRLNTISVEYHEVTKQQRNSLALMGLDAFNNRHNGSGVDWSIRVDNNELQKPEYDWARALLSSLPERAYAPGVLS